MCMSILPECMSAHCVCTVPVEAQRGCQIPGTGVTDVVSYHVGSGNQDRVLWKSSQCFSRHYSTILTVRVLSVEKWLNNSWMVFISKKANTEKCFSHSIAIYLTEQYISLGQGFFFLFTEEGTMYRRTSLKLLCAKYIIIYTKKWYILYMLCKCTKNPNKHTHTN